MIPVWAVAILAAVSADRSLLPMRDFVEYWAAGRVHLDGGNPYDPATVLPLQRAAADMPDQSIATMLWTPPWTLPLYWPFAALPPGSGHVVWVLAQLAMTLAASGLLWRTYGGPVARGGVLAGFLVAAGFAPVWWMVGFGQNTGFLILGLAGFVSFRANGRPGVAGVFAALTAIKPHVLALFGVALVLDGLTRRGWKSLAVGGGVLAGLGVLALVPNPGVYAEFAAALGRPPTDEIVPLYAWQVPTFAYRLRMWVAGGVFGGEHGEMFWVQFVPCLAGCAAVVPYWWVRRKAWDWATETPRLVFASVLLAPYGAWIFDLTVLLVPVVQAAARLAVVGRPTWRIIAALALVAVSLSTFNPRFVGALHDTIWFPPAVLVGCVTVAFVAGPTRRESEG